MRVFEQVFDKNFEKYYPIKTIIDINMLLKIDVFVLVKNPITNKTGYWILWEI